MIRRCPQCGTTSDDMYGFCIKCGREFTQTQVNTGNCPLCGFNNPEEADYCVKCGTPLVFKQMQENPNNNPNPVVTKIDYAGNTNPHHNKTSRILIIFGYVFSILGGLLGLIIAIYLSTRKDPNARKHGHIQLAIFAFYIALIVILYLTGNIPADIITQYKQILAGNLTSIQR